MLIAITIQKLGGMRPCSFPMLFVVPALPLRRPGAAWLACIVVAGVCAFTDPACGTTPIPKQASSNSVDYGSLYHNTFDPYYRSAEGAVPAGSSVTLRLRTAHFGASAVTLRTYLFDTGSGTTKGPNDSAMSFLENRTENGTLYDEWTITYTTPSTPTIVYYKFVVSNGSATAYYSDDYVDDYDNLNKDGTGTASATEPFDSFQITAYDPGFQTPAWLANAIVYQIFPDRFRNGDPTNDYCVSGSSSGCPSFYGGGPSDKIITIEPWNTLLCDPRQSGSSCSNDFGGTFYGGDLLGIQNRLDYLQNPPLVRNMIAEKRAAVHA
jgi:hypothetical protein